MTILPVIQIRQQYGLLAFDADPATLSIRQPKADIQITTTPSKIITLNPPGQLQIDQSKAWDALGIGPHLDAISRVYTRSKQLFLEHLARKVEEGNRMMNIHQGGNAIADISKERTMEGVHLDELNFIGPASFDNVDISFIPGELEIKIVPKEVQIQVQANKPEIEAARGKFNAYMARWPSIEIIPPSLDMKV